MGSKYLTKLHSLGLSRKEWSSIQDGKSVVDLCPAKSLIESDTSSASDCRKYWFRPADKEFVEGMRLEQHKVRSHQHIAH